MRSLVIIEVEHDETTDGVDQFLADCISEENWNDVTVLASTVRVDLPTCFTLRDGE